jgi:hypothetical protein
MCQECARIQVEYQRESARLSTAQRELALYKLGNDQIALAPLWTECVSALRALWRLREEMAKHAAGHAEGSLSASV